MSKSSVDSINKFDKAFCDDCGEEFEFCECSHKRHRKIKDRDEKNEEINGDYSFYRE